MKNKRLLTQCLVGLGITALFGAAGAEPITQEQAVKEATTSYPGKVVVVTQETSPEGRKQFAVQVQSGIYDRKVMVDVESGKVDMIYYRVSGRTAWIAKKVPLGAPRTNSNGTAPEQKPNP
jgi:hypothetical protein